jgi:purine-binding chemotaxis protein CheW
MMANGDPNKIENVNKMLNENDKSKGGKFLTFFLANEEYGLEILKVVEIIGMMDVTPVPRTPVFIKGVINLRGKVIPVMDLRIKFGMEAVEQTDETVIIVVNAHNMEMGIVVDKVSEVLDIASESVEDSPAFGTEVNTEYILGIGKSDGNVKLLLDIDKILTTQDIVEIQSAKSTRSQDNEAMRDMNAE